MSTPDAAAEPAASASVSPEPTSTTPNATTTPSDASDPAAARLARWKALQKRAKTSTQTNMKEVYAERRRAAIDPTTNSRLERKKAEAEFKIARAEAAEAGSDFERKRAWDWTVEESERWDKRIEKKQKHRDDVKFQDFSQTARKMYKKSLREIKPDLAAYEEEKAKLMGKGKVVETEDGELVLVDTEGEFYADGQGLGFVDNKPKKENVDRLVAELKKDETKKLRRKEGVEEEDVTYINDKNKNFNQKLARAYGAYTKEIRDSFERGTMI